VLAHTGVAAAHLGVFATVRRLIIGRRLTVRTADGDLTLTVTELMSRRKRSRMICVRSASGSRSWSSAARFRNGVSRPILKPTPGVGIA
jgi:hypothetical protein